MVISFAGVAASAVGCDTLMYAKAGRILAKTALMKSGKRPPTLLGVEYFTDANLMVLRASRKLRLELSESANSVRTNRYCTWASVRGIC